MNLKLPVLSAALFLCAPSINAQVSAYTFSQSLGTYGTPLTGTVINTPVTLDEVIPTALPFTFTFNGVPYSNVNICSNGFMSFSAIGGSEYSPISDPTTTEIIAGLGNLVAPASSIFGDITAGSNTITNCSSVAGYSVGDLLADINGDFGADPVITAIVGNSIVVNLTAITSNPGTQIGAYGTIVKFVSGVAPNRVFEVEYRHTSRLNFSFDLIPDEVLDFKIKLYETSNRIEVVYKLIPGQDLGPVNEVGLKGASNADWNSRSVTNTNSWATSSAAAAITDFCDLSPTLAPVFGQTYAWAPLNCVTPTLSVSQTPSLSCPGFSAVLTASGATSYSWTGGPTTAQYTISPNATTNYTLIGADDVCTSTIVVTHSVIAGPALGVTSGNNQLCSGASAVLTATGATSYTWTGGPQTAAYTVSPAVTTVYTVTGSNGGVCAAQITFTQNVIQYPVLGITQGSMTICPGQTAILTATGATTYSWSNGQTTAQASVTPASTTVYTLTGSNQNCVRTATVSQNVSLCTGIMDNTLENSVSVYPNPFRSELNLSNSGDSEMTVTISDALGKTVHSSVIKGNSTGTIHTDDLNTGLYIIKISNGSQSLSRKLVKTN